MIHWNYVYICYHDVLLKFTTFIWHCGSWTFCFGFFFFKCARLNFKNKTKLLSLAASDEFPGKKFRFFFFLNSYNTFCCMRVCFHFLLHSCVQVNFASYKCICNVVTCRNCRYKFQIIRGLYIISVAENFAELCFNKIAVFPKCFTSIFITIHSFISSENRQCFARSCEYLFIVLRCKLMIVVTLGLCVFIEQTCGTR